LLALDGKSAKKAPFDIIPRLTKNPVAQKHVARPSAPSRPISLERAEYFLGGDVTLGLSVVDEHHFEIRLIPSPPNQDRRHGMGRKSSPRCAIRIPGSGVRGMTGMGPVLGKRTKWNASQQDTKTAIVDGARFIGVLGHLNHRPAAGYDKSLRVYPCR